MTSSDPPVQISLDQFCAMVRSGQVRPDALYREPWTLGEWRTVDNLRLFHELSPACYPEGPRLLAEEESGRRQSQLRQIAKAYRSGTLVADEYRVRPLGGAAEGAGVAGSARLMIFSGRWPERIVTVAFGPDLAVEVVTGRTQLWSTLQRRACCGVQGEAGAAAETFSAREAIRQSRHLPYRRAPQPFSSWGHFVGAASSATACSTDTLDGTSYRHQMIVHGRLLDVRWDNPDCREHPAQIALANGYLDLLKAVRTGSFVQ